MKYSTAELVAAVATSAQARSPEVAFVAVHRAGPYPAWGLRQEEVSVEQTVRVVAAHTAVVLLVVASSSAGV